MRSKLSIYRTRDGMRASHKTKNNMMRYFKRVSRNDIMASIMASRGDFYLFPDKRDLRLIKREEERRSAFHSVLQKAVMR